MLQWLIGLDVNPGRRVLDSQLVVAGLGYFFGTEASHTCPSTLGIKVSRTRSRKSAPSTWCKVKSTVLWLVSKFKHFCGWVQLFR